VLDFKYNSNRHDENGILSHFSDRKIEANEIDPTKVTQGKTLQNMERRYAAKHAVDKDLSTFSATQTDNRSGWLKLKLDRSYFIHKIIIYYRFYTNWYDPDEGCTKSVDKFKDCIDRCNNVDVSVYQGDVKQKSCGTLQLTYGLEQSDQIYELICNTEGDSVKLSKDTGNIAIYEIVIMGPGVWILSLLRDEKI
jgi:hypothetical protein